MNKDSQALCHLLCVLNTPTGTVTRNPDLRTVVLQQLPQQLPAAGAGHAVGDQRRTQHPQALLVLLRLGYTKKVDLRRLA